MKSSDNICRNCKHLYSDHKKPNDRFAFAEKCNICKCSYWRPHYDYLSDEQKIDTEHQDEPVCPHCGEETGNIWEFQLDEDRDTQIQCGSCEKEFIINMRISLSYSTFKINEK